MLNIFAQAMVTLVALLHIYFMVLEIFFWEKPLGLRIFGLKPEFAKASRAIAANQGLYNGFLAAGLIWGVLSGTNGFSLKIFFLTCVTLAGIFGGLTANRKILFIQALPAGIAMLLTIIAERIHS